MKDKTICVMGLGYIGLPTASLLGTKGYAVHGVDVSPSVVDTINQGQIHIVEPDLDVMVKSAVGAGNLVASLEPKEADVFILAVPTPFKGDHEPDLSYVEEATRKIAPYVKPGNLVILESTSPVGTTDEVIAPILKDQGLKVGEEVFVAHCPERVLPGRILIELVENDRVVGGVNDTSTKAAVDFYREFVRGEVVPTTAKTAEMVKLTENSSRDVQIAFANELSLICEDEGTNVWEVIRLANRHPRVNILKPGPGVGGHCIAVDPWFLVSRNPQKTNLIKTARIINDGKPQWVIDKVTKIASRFHNPKIACLGLSFKADVDDLRESPAMKIVESLKNLSIGELLFCEPNIDELEGYSLVPLNAAVDEADILLVLVDHKEFYSLKNLNLLDKIVIDTRGILEK